MRASFAFTGAVLIGLAIGMAIGQIGVGSLLGVGIGFVLWAFLDHRGESFTRRYWRNQRAALRK